MFGRLSRVYSRILLAVDVGAGAAALLVAYYLRTLIPLVPVELSERFNPILLPFRDYFIYFLAFLPIWIVLLDSTQRYNSVYQLPVVRQVARVIQFVVLAGFSMGFLAYTFQLEVSRPILFGFLALTCGLLLVNRTLFHWILRSRNINEHNQTKILIVGADGRAADLGRRLKRFGRWGYHVVGYVSTGDEEGLVGNSELPVLGSLADLPKLLLDHAVADEIVFLGTNSTDISSFEEMIELCGELGLKTRVVADFFPSDTSTVSIDFLDDLPLITLSMGPDHSVALVAKRVVDFGVALVSLVLMSPLMLALAGAVKFTSPGPVFYRQKRCGLFGRTFTLIKFRTMIDGAQDRLWEIKHLNEMSGPVFKMRNDPRITTLGRFLRKFSLDELPQFWNVIKGEMSVVGPRAPLPEEVRHYSVRQRRRLSVKPGITCLWQVSGRNEIDFQKWMDLDLQYIDNWSIWLDFRIMLKTIPAVFSGRGAR